MELYSYFSIHHGPRYSAAGLRVQFHYNQVPGIHFKVPPPEEYREAILRGLQEGLTLRFPDFPSTGSLWVTEITVHEVDSNARAFYRVARLVIDQARSLADTAKA